MDRLWTKLRSMREKLNQAVALFEKFVSKAVPEVAPSPPESPTNSMECDIADVQPEPDIKCAAAKVEVSTEAVTNEKEFPPLAAAKRKAKKRRGKAQLDTDTTTTEADPSAHPKKAARIPPVILRYTAKWTEITANLVRAEVKIAKAKTCQDGIRIQPLLSDEFRALTKHLDAEKLPYHTFSMEEEKTLRVVLKPIPVGIDADELEEDLKHQGFHPIKVSRMVHSSGKKPLQNFLVELPTAKSCIFQDLKAICSLIVFVEKPHKLQHNHNAASVFTTHRSTATQTSNASNALVITLQANASQLQGVPRYPKSKSATGQKPRNSAKPAVPKQLAKPAPKMPRTSSYDEAASSAAGDVSAKGAQLIPAFTTAKDTKSMVACLLNFLPLLL
ncbi:PRE C2HC domain containing protein [Asbolus verrucosus]|uniref:PRE C2HC domain containing protein n=1 Tax=Asbolus verrucosus TaxID=1661398 RepID=A0A482VVA2_ASBVE|nr:PRE C2HC domain containing protein [Asbolus verrucosus]